MKIDVEKKKSEYTIHITDKELQKIHDELGEFAGGIIALAEKHPALHKFYLASLDALVNN